MPLAHNWLRFIDQRLYSPQWLIAKSSWKEGHFIQGRKAKRLIFVEKILFVFDLIGFSYSMWETVFWNRASHGVEDPSVRKYKSWKIKCSHIQCMRKGRRTRKVSTRYTLQNLKLLIWRQQVRLNIYQIRFNIYWYLYYNVFCFRLVIQMFHNVMESLKRTYRVKRTARATEVQNPWYPKCLGFF